MLFRSRVGRAGHRVGEPSRGVLFPKYRGDLLEAAVVARRMHEGAIETTVMPRNPLDVLAQQLVAMTVMDPWTVADLLGLVTRAAPFEGITREALEGVLGMLAGAYPSDEFAELKARVAWDRVTDVVEGRRDARVVAVTSGGTIRSPASGGRQFGLPNTTRTLLRQPFVSRNRRQISTNTCTLAQSGFQLWSACVSPYTGSSSSSTNVPKSLSQVMNTPA